jgi:hypothetical protein
LSLAACGTTGPETGTDVEDVQEDAENAEEQVDEQAESGYDGLYDQSFYDDTESLDGETVTVSANVNMIISDNGFTIAGTDETTVDELLIVHDGDYPELEPGLTVAVTGTVHHVFTIEDVESEGIGLDEQLYADWENTPYIDATSVDLSVPTEPGDSIGDGATEPDEG